MIQKVSDLRPINMNKAVIGLLVFQGLTAMFLIDEPTLGGWSLLGAFLITVIELIDNE